MNKEESLALFKQGKDAWNAWAEEMLAQRKALEGAVACNLAPSFSAISTPACSPPSTPNPPRRWPTTSSPHPTPAPRPRCSWTGWWGWGEEVGVESDLTPPRDDPKF